ncbi:hypothetical protein PVAND_012267 [Polypedilum vanderplanki]|uniref:NEDD8 ultimate buster 1-like protein n=1 Tax=Polypedilum vanderplanki TaxID=319348 RepID=A0A9J6CMV5_POLVA|nr:hypothetical protein PVAND_012267 [Polypedilum vanderplanki]
MSELTFESVLIQVKAALQDNKIKLWEPPYYLNTVANDTEMINLANNFRDILNIKFDYCLAALNELQNHAVDKLKSNEELKNEGLATLKIKFPSKKVLGGQKLFDVKVKLTDNAENLRALISNELSLNETRLKLISGGKVLNDGISLQEQNVKNFQQILVLEIEINEEQAALESQPYDRIQKIRKDAEILLKNKNSSYFNLENQNGEQIHLPEQERISLMMALLLYEKGRAQLKNDNFNDALILFLEADNEIQNCQSSIIKSIDNVALLNLDIVWCYLQLKSITQLPDAERRLQLCEASFKRTYGENFERVKLIKNSDASERCLIVRLKLMKAILYFHQNRRIEASSYLSLAEQEILELKVDDEKVNMLMEMGYSKSEAMISLRSTYNTTIDSAVNFIIERRSKLKSARKSGKKERLIGEFLDNIGLKANPKKVCSLIEMGFTRELAALALQKSNDDLENAIMLLQTQQDQLKTELKDCIKPDPALVERLKTFGFDETLITNILKININNFDTALDALLKMKNDENFQIPSELMNIINQGASTSSAPSCSLTNNDSENKKLRLENKITPEEEQAIFDDLRNDLDHLDEDDEYLTFTLEKELELLNQYKRALGN